MILSRNAHEREKCLSQQTKTEVNDKADRQTLASGMHFI